ncbi:MAG: FAD-dependent oxidoreductase, partial [Synechocystis sp.]
AYEALLAGKTVCMTELTDWVGGQLTSQGTSALDEKPTQTEKLFYPRGYLELRRRIKQFYGVQDPGNCWVSRSSCFLPKDGHTILMAQLKNAEREGKGQLKWFPATVIKELEIKPVGQGEQITAAIAIQHQPAPGAPPLNNKPLSQTLADSYRYEDSEQLTKTLIRFVPPTARSGKNAHWLVVEATETGELIALADVPYRVGIDPRTFRDPSSSSVDGFAYCTQGFTYTFAMEATAAPQPQPEPAFYAQYSPYYSYDQDRFNFDGLFTYRRIWSPDGLGVFDPAPEKFDKNRYGVSPAKPGEISMQNWLPGNDYTPGTAKDNLIYTRDQLQQTGQLQPGQWQGGLRIESLQNAEELALGFYHWLTAGTTDAKLGDEKKKPNPNNILLTGLDSPMGTEHGLSKFPYMREGRRILGRPDFIYPDGFEINETDISRRKFESDFYRENLSPREYRRLHADLAGIDGLDVLNGTLSPDEVQRRQRATIYPDSVGIGHYNIDFHPCYLESPVEKPGNIERPGERQAHTATYPFQIPLRAMSPQRIDNLLVVGKSIATSHIAAAAYRVHSFEWSSGAAAGITAAEALKNDYLPYELVDKVPVTADKRLLQLRQKIDETNNPTAFPDTSIFTSFEDWQ